MPIELSNRYVETVEGVDMITPGHGVAIWHFSGSGVISSKKVLKIWSSRFEPEISLI